MKFTNSIDIDNKEDLKLAKLFLNNKKCPFLLIS